MDAIRYALEIEPIEINKEFWNFFNKHSNFFKGDIFNWITEDEFIDYCRQRFPDIKWGHETIEKYWIA